MSYRNIKKGFNISDADYHRLPERRKKFYTRNEVRDVPRIDYSVRPEITPSPQAPRATSAVIYEDAPRRREDRSLLDDIATGMAIGAGISIAENVIGGLFGGDDNNSSSDFSSSSDDISFGGGDFGGAGAGGEW